MRRQCVSELKAVFKRNLNHYLVNNRCSHLRISTRDLLKYWKFVESQRYKQEGCELDSRLCHWNFSLTQSFRQHYGLGFDSASNRDEYQEYFLGWGGKSGQRVGLTTLPPSCADFLVMWEPQPPGTLRDSPGLKWDCFTFTGYWASRYGFNLACYIPLYFVNIS